MADASWGDWMGAWKAEEGQVDVEQDRLSRAQAAFGGETLARMKDLNVLLLGCRGVGVETAKNLILSNVGNVTVWDPVPARQEDRGANFYISEAGVGKPRAAECLAQLKSLNPYCKVDLTDVAEASLLSLLDTPNVSGTGRGFSAVVVTVLLPRQILVALNEKARAKGIVFLLAVNLGVTATLFSDFGPRHVITDEDGEPTQMLAVAGASVITVSGIVKIDGAKEGDKVLVLSLASDHNLHDGDSVSLDDMRGELAGLNGKQLKVRRFVVLSPLDAKVDLKDVAVKELLKSPTDQVLTNFTKQYTHYKEAFDGDAANAGKKFPQREITLFNRLCLVIEDDETLKTWGSYTSGGLINSVKQPIIKEYASLEKALAYTANPQMMDQEAWHAGEGCWVQIALAAGLRFQEAKGRWPKLLDRADASELVAIGKAISEENKSLEGACWFQKVEWGFPSGEPADAEAVAALEAKLLRFSLLMEAEMTGLCAFLGGVAAQEVIKKTGKFLPLEQWLHHDDPCLVNEQVVAEDGLGRFAGSRYAYQVAVTGTDAMEALQKQRVFLVGCGALGCEYMKGLALMGACTAPASKLIVTDMDNIEVSNLSRQFLFRQGDVGSAKSTTAARVVKGWNNELQVEALEKGVGTTSEDFFDDVFWTSQDLCWNALDNVVARKYTDKCCLWYSLPLLESGTLGTKSNSDVFLPGLTKSYNDGVENDSNETQIAMCTLRSFPYLPIHCIEYSKQAFFSDYMEFAPQQYEAFRKDPAGFFEQLDAMSDVEQFKALKMIKNFITIQTACQVDFNMCVRVAFDHYCRDFITSIRDLVHNCDEMEKASGKPFWTGTKRRPTEAKWDSKCPPAAALEYLYATSNCYAFIWGLDYVRNRAAFKQIVIDMSMEAPAWSPPTDGKVETEEEGDNETADPAAIEALKADLYKVDPASLKPCSAHDFEKDDDSNFHVDFLTVGCNARAACYNIKQSDRAHVKVTAGRIIPALATTTAMICGLVDVEFLKLVKGLHKGENALDKFYNANINLATGSQAVNLFRPEPAEKKKTNVAAMPECTSWDKVEVAGEITLEAFVNELETRFGVTVQRIFPSGEDKICVFDRSQIEKQNWRIEILEGGKVLIEPEDVYTAWPQLRMAAQMIGRVPEGAARKNFASQIEASAKSLQNVKDTFTTGFRGPVSEAYLKVARPSAEEPEKRKYFDAVCSKRSYIALQANVLNKDGSEAELPLIRYTFKK
jgi:ubiquitin-activating enzyme E1